MSLYPAPSTADAVTSDLDSYQDSVSQVAVAAANLDYGPYFSSTGKATVNVGTDFDVRSDIAPAEYGKDPDYTVGGKSGYVNTNPYVIGVVDPNTVESFDYNGAMVRVRRPRESSPGPVGAFDYASQLSLAYAQSVVQQAFEENSELSMIMGI